MERIRVNGCKTNFKTYSIQGNVSPLSNLPTALEFLPTLSIIGTGIGKRNSESCEMKEGQSQESGLQLPEAGSKSRGWIKQKMSLHYYVSGSATFQVNWRPSIRNMRS